MYESVKKLEIKSFMKSKLAFADNVVSSCFSLFFLTIDLYFLIFVIIGKYLILL